MHPYLDMMTTKSAFSDFNTFYCYTFLAVLFFNRMQCKNFQKILIQNANAIIFGNQIFWKMKKLFHHC